MELGFNLPLRGVRYRATQKNKKEKVARVYYGQLRAEVRERNSRRCKYNR